MFLFPRHYLIPLLALALAGPVLAAQDQAPGEEARQRPVIEVFYKQMPPSLETREKVGAFLEGFQDVYEIRYLDMADSTVAELMRGLGLPTEHFPFGLAVEGKTSAEIDGRTILFTHFPDFMHHIGKHRGNWTLEHLEAVLTDRELLLPENPVVESNPGGQ